MNFAASMLLRFRPIPAARVAFVAALMMFCVNGAFCQTAYFVDGWHGGVWGHYPPWVTQFLVDQMKRYPQWKINLEIEPETWDWVEANTPDAYKAFVALAAGGA